MLLWRFLFLGLCCCLPLFQCTSVHDDTAPSARQDSPLSGALTGLFAPPFIVAVGMGALAHTFERFVTDVVKSASRRGLRRRRKKKKPANQEPIKPFPPLQVAPPPPPPPAPVAPPVAAQDAAPAGRYKWIFG